MSIANKMQFLCDGLQRRASKKNMKCLIISGGEFSPVKLNEKYDLIIACDRGYLYAKKLKIKPDIIVGDFDSSPIPKNINEKISIIKVSSIKDDTDTSLAIKYALRNGYKNIDIICALGNRLDHTLANIQMMKFIVESGGVCRILSSKVEIRTLKIGLNKINKNSKKRNNRITINSKNTKNKTFSIFSLSDKSKIKHIKGSKYDIKDITIKNNFPLGVSNEFVKSEVSIYVDSGVVIAVI